MHPLLLTGPPAAGKSTTADAVARSRPRGAYVDVDDVRHLVVSGHAAPWDGDEGRRQQHLGVENACDFAARLSAAGIDVVLADVIDATTLALYRRRLPGLVVVELRLSLAAARRRAASRPVHLTDREFEDLHAAQAGADLAVDRVVDVEALSRDDQVRAVLAVWISVDEAAS